MQEITNERRDDRLVKWFIKVAAKRSGETCRGILFFRGWAERPTSTGHETAARRFHADENVRPTRQDPVVQ